LITCPAHKLEINAKGVSKEEEEEEEVEED
jgi:hypothetical protein